MNRLLNIIFCLIFNLGVKAQDNVFVLVDVSGSVKNSIWITEGRNIINDICRGTFNRGKYPNWILDGVNDPRLNSIINSSSSKGLLSNNSKFGLSVFGDIYRYNAYSLNIHTLTNFPDDFNIIFSKEYPSSFRDNWTYYDIALASIAQQAKNSNINEYYLITIWDGAGESQKTGASYTTTQDDLINKYNNMPQSDRRGIGTIKIEQGNSKRYKIEFQKVRLDSLNLIIQSPPPTSTIAAITLTSFTNGKKNEPKPTSSNSFPISWNCNCPTGTIFNVLLTEIDGGDYKDRKPNLTTNSVNFTDVPSGKFRIVVSAANATSASTFIKTPSGSFGWVIFLLILLIVIGIGYYYWSKKRQEKIDVFASNKTDDIFSGNSSGSSSNSSSNSDYF